MPAHLCKHLGSRSSARCAIANSDRARPSFASCVHPDQAQDDKTGIPRQRRDIEIHCKQYNLSVPNRSAKTNQLCRQIRDLLQHTYRPRGRKDFGRARVHVGEKNGMASGHTDRRVRRRISFRAVLTGRLLTWLRPFFITETYRASSPSSLDGAWCTIQGYEAIHYDREGTSEMAGGFLWPQPSYPVMDALWRVGMQVLPGVPPFGVSPRRSPGMARWYPRWPRWSGRRR